MSAPVQHLDESSFEAAVNSGVTLVDFWAPWCRPCLMQGEILDSLADALDGSARIAKVNVDESPGLANRFGVRSIPTLVILRDGQPVQQLVGVQPAPTLVRALAAAG